MIHHHNEHLDIPDKSPIQAAIRCGNGTLLIRWSPVRIWNVLPIKFNYLVPQFCIIFAFLHVSDI
jgi:hypothetical protein